MNILRTVGVLCVLATASAVSSANVGFFLGDGHTVQLQKTDEIQLVSEDVRIVVVSAGADYFCRFELKNLTDRAVIVQVGFPLTSDAERGRTSVRDSAGKGFVARDVDHAEVVSEDYRFIARDAGRTYHVRYVEQDLDARFRHLLLWDMEFAPGETIELSVSYSLSLSFTLFSTDRRVWEAFYTDTEIPDALFIGDDWLTHVSRTAMLVHCQYVTETGASWAGGIEDARFRLHTSALEEEILAHGLDGAVFSRSTDNYVPGRSLTWRGLRPEGWIDAPKGAAPAGELQFPLVGPGPSGTVEWHFAPFVPGPRIVVSYIETRIPAEAEAVRAWMETLGEPSASDVAELRQVLLAMCGVAPPKGRVHDIVEMLVWYAPIEGRTEADLDERQKALLAAYDLTAPELLDGTLAVSVAQQLAAEEARGKTPDQRAKEDLSRLSAAVTLFKVSEGRHPAAIDDLVQPIANYPEGCLGTPSVPLDPWGHGYRFALGEEGKPVLWSVGPDGIDQQGSGDDILKAKR